MKDVKILLAAFSLMEKGWLYIKAWLCAVF